MFARLLTFASLAAFGVALGLALIGSTLLPTDPGTHDLGRVAAALMLASLVLGAAAMWLEAERDTQL